MEGIVVKKKNKSVILSIIIGLMFSCLGVLAMFSSFNNTAKAEGESTAMIVVDAGATTTIDGGTIGTMENGNSIYIADTGILNMTGGTVEGNIYNAGTFNYTAGSVASVTLASGKYITFKGAPTTVISITLDNPVIGENVGYLSGISTLDLTLLSVTNLPANTELKLVNNYVQIASTIREVTITADPSGYGTVSANSLSVINSTTLTVSGATITDGTTTVTATPATQTDQYTYAFDGFYVGATKITSTYSVTANTTVTAKFTATLRTYTVTLVRNNSSYGTLSTYSVTDVPYGTVIKVGSSANIIGVNGTNVTATSASSTNSNTFAFSSWKQDSSTGTTITTTGFTLTGDKTIYAVFTSSTRYYTVYAYARYSTSSTGTNSGSGSTTGVTGGTVSLYTSYQTTAVTTTGSSSVSRYSPYNGTAYYTATPAEGYEFVGWYSSPTATTATSTSPSYSCTITSAKTLYAFFRTAPTYTVSVDARYSNTVGATNAEATTGTTGGTVSISETSVLSGNTTTLTATAETGYTFRGWYTSTTSTTSESTSATYSPTITGNVTYYALFTPGYYGAQLYSYYRNFSGVLPTAPSSSLDEMYQYIASGYEGGGTVTIKDVKALTDTFCFNEAAHMYVFGNTLLEPDGIVPVSITVTPDEGYYFVGLYIVDASSAFTSDTADSASSMYSSMYYDMDTRSFTKQTSLNYNKNSFYIYALFCKTDTTVLYYQSGSVGGSSTIEFTYTSSVNGTVTTKTATVEALNGATGSIPYAAGTDISIKVTPASGYSYVGARVGDSSTAGYLISTEQSFVYNPGLHTDYLYFDFVEEGTHAVQIASRYYPLVSSSSDTTLLTNGVDGSLGGTLSTYSYYTSSDGSVAYDSITSSNNIPIVAKYYSDKKLYLCAEANTGYTFVGFYSYNKSAGTYTQLTTTSVSGNVAWIVDYTITSNMNIVAFFKKSSTTTFKSSFSTNMDEVDSIYSRETAVYSEKKEEESTIVDKIG